MVGSVLILVGACGGMVVHGAEGAWIPMRFSHPHLSAMLAATLIHIHVPTCTCVRAQAEAVMSNVMANLEEDEEEVHHAPSTTKEAVAEVLQNYYKSVMSSFRTRDGILVICWWIWTIGGVLWFKYSEGMSFMVAIYFITTSYNTSGMVDPGNSNAALITTTVFLLIGFPLNVFTWTTVMNNAFVAFKTDKV